MMRRVAPADRGAGDPRGAGGAGAAVRARAARAAVPSVARTLVDLPQEDVLEAHAALAPGVELEGDHAVRVLRGRIDVVDGGHAVDPGLHVRPVHDRANVVPASDDEGLLRRVRGLDEPSPPAALVEPARVQSGMGVDLDLDALDVHAVEGRVIEDAAVARALRLEAGLELEVPIGLLRGQVAVLLGHRLAEDLA